MIIQTRSGRMLVEKWQTELLAPEEYYGPMITIRLPGPIEPQDPEEHNHIQDELHYSYRIEVPIKKINHRLYVRLENCQFFFLIFFF